MKSFNLTIYLFLILSCITLMNFQCNDCDDELHDRTNFSVTPNSTQNIISIGDTLIINTSFNSLIELEFSGSIHDNSNQLINYRLEIFEGQNNNIDAIQGRDNFEFINLIGNVFIPPARTWEIVIENTCDENLCELEFGIIPQQTGYYGISLQTGSFGFEDECQFLTLIPTEIQSNGDNNFEIFEEINISSIRIDGTYFGNPEREKLLYFFKVIE
ncbi:MAG: hypothetical protein H6577_04380 [Lewinellaceae bacterium]|nr:hypothetical protein [Saprospiraceae bacterium]MCB9337338.1 hypothetical protein [Lewinellaceae bacterium]